MLSSYSFQESDFNFFLAFLRLSLPFVMSLVRGVGDRLTQYQPVGSRHLREVLKEISAKQVFPQFSFLLARAPGRISFSLAVPFPISLTISPARAIRVEAEGSRERKRKREEEASWKDDYAGPLAIISLATTRQMSDYCETHRLVGRFSLFSCSRCYGNNNHVG